MTLQITTADALLIVVVCLFAIFGVEASYQERRRARARRPGPNERRK